MIVTNSLTGGGAERSMNLVSNELTKRGWPVGLVPINSSEPDLIIPACEVFPLSRQWRGSALSTFLAIIKFNRVVNKWKPDLIVLNTDLPELFGALLFSRQQTLIVVQHSNLAWANRIRFGKVIRKILSLRSSVWVAVSSHLRIWPTGQSPRAILQNPLTPSIETIGEMKASHLRRLIYIGRLSLEKRPDQILKIGEQTGIDVEIVGDGEMRESLQDEATRKKLRVAFKGYVRDPWSLVQSGDLLVIPSASEGDGLVVIEGLKRKMPMLLSDIADFRRFEFPEKNYCKKVNDFVERITLYSEELDSLVVPEDRSKSILVSRSLENVVISWENLFNSL